ncbi:RNA-binding protein 7 isoform X2 [Cherax quadricarinatus]
MTEASVESCFSVYLDEAFLLRLLCKSLCQDRSLPQVLDTSEGAQKARNHHQRGDMDDESRTVWVGNFDPERVTQELLYELFLQAGPLHYVRIPKDRATGKLKNFAFVCYRHDVSVAYAIELLNGIQLFKRNLKVQSRYLQNLQQSGAASGPGGIHTLDPFCSTNAHIAIPQRCVQQSLMGAASGFLGAPAGNIPINVLQMAQKQVLLLAANQPILLSDNPMLNAPRHQTFDRDGSVNYGRHYPSQREIHYGGQNRYHGNSTGRPRSLDNETMQAMKSHFNRQAEDNSKMLAQIHQQQGRFDYSRLGPPRTEHSNRQNDDRYSRHNDDRYSRHNDDRYSRHNERHDSASRHQRYSDNYGGFHNHNDRSGRNRHDPYSRSSRH